ncbi:MAG: GTPases - Sulfate adenylate transferase subunit 1 [Candidatus Tokpelaia sp. JSC085]|nr:MAG: GTPases - Sulfate adenylate transferase subunit 1 [Candidatus Tokpelaia sp. JSC085]
MSAVPDLLSQINSVSQAEHHDGSLLRFITCGSVDDGKSTLIGRLLHDTGSIFEDQMETFQHESKKFNAADNALNFALLVDGLSAEREQGITIDVAYRYFSSKRRFFIIADTPGHEQYTRNMATGASQADLAIILIDARKGVLPQTRRHSFITSMVGIRSVVVAVNKMDLIHFDQSVFDRIIREYKSLLPQLDFRETIFIPLSAQLGINVVNRSNRMPWYNGPTLFEYLETARPIDSEHTGELFRMPVQWINRPNSDFRGFCGVIASGSLSIGDVIRSLPSGATSRVRKIYNPAGETDRVSAGEVVVLTLEDEIDISRGNVLVSEDDAITISRAIRSQILWMSTHPMVAEKRYLLKLATSLIPVTINQLEEKIDIHSYYTEKAQTLGPNEIGHVLLNLEQPLVTTSYRENRTLGAFILIDLTSNETVALGIVRDTFPNIGTESERIRPAIFARLKKAWLGKNKKGKCVLFRLAYGAMLTAFALIFGVSFVGAWCIFIFYFTCHPLLETLFVARREHGQRFLEDRSGM